jgi:hypothetical protein
MLTDLEAEAEDSRYKRKQNIYIYDEPEEENDDEYDPEGPFDMQIDHIDEEFSSLRNDLFFDEYFTKGKVLR